MHGTVVRNHSLKHLQILLATSFHLCLIRQAQSLNYNAHTVDPAVQACHLHIILKCVPTASICTAGISPLCQHGQDCFQFLVEPGPSKCAGK